MVGGAALEATPTWSAELAVLLLLAGVHVHAGLVEGEGEEVVQAGGGAGQSVEALQPLLALLEGGELTPGQETLSQEQEEEPRNPV